MTEPKLLRWHTLSTMALSPKACKRAAETTREDTPALFAGRVIHCATLEPGRFLRDYRRQPDFGDLRTKAGKEARAEWMAANSDAEPVSQDVYDLAVRCARSVESHPRALAILARVRTEVEITWDIDGTACGGRVDILRPVGIADLKSTRHETLRAMQADFARHLYHGQMAWYHDGAVRAGLVKEPETPSVIAVQTVEPYDVAVMQMSDESLMAGRALYSRLLKTWIGCQAASWWPGLAPDVVTWDLPGWAEGMADLHSDEEDVW